MKIRKKMTLPALGRRFCAISLVLLCTVAMGQNDAENVSSGEISASGVPLPLPLPLAEWSKIRQQINSGKLQAVNPLGSGPVFQQQAYIKASNTGDDDRFAYSLSISADTLVVGTYFEDSSATGIDGDQTDNMATSAGAAYVYVRNGSVWTQQAYLKASNAEAFDQFGISVAISGDTIVVGASGEASVATGVNGDQTDNTMDFTGAAYVFVRDGVTWT